MAGRCRVALPSLDVVGAWRQGPRRAVPGWNVWTVVAVPCRAFSRSPPAPGSSRHRGEDEELLGAELAVPPGLTPSQAYNHLVQCGKVVRDDKQASALRVLDGLHARIAAAYPSTAFTPAPANQRHREVEEAAPSGGFGLFRSLFSSTAGVTALAPSSRRTALPGVYLYGGPGCGKTFTMDLFYRCLRTPLKRRVHFHSFMLDVHARLHKVRGQGHRGDPIPVVARDMVADTAIMCFDEMQVTDVGDAMILRRLVTALFDHGLTVVATSNRPPRDLYANGLQRELFLPFIDLVEARCTVHDMDSATDYRLHAAQALAGHTWITPATAGGAVAGGVGGAGGAGEHHRHGVPGLAVEDGGMPPAIHAAIEAAWVRVLGGDSETDTVLTTQGRNVVVPRAGQRAKAARFTFEQLCNQPLGSADYQVLCQNYATIVLDFVPVLTLANRNELRRFITFIDTAYEHRVKLVAGGATLPHALFQPLATLHDPGADPAGATAVAASKRQYDEAFAFDRTVSRLMEMQSRGYLESEWRPKISAGFVEADP